MSVRASRKYGPELVAVPLRTECHYCGVPIANTEWCKANGGWWEATKWATDRCRCGGWPACDLSKGERCAIAGVWHMPAGIWWLEWDHKTPRRHGGSDDRHNLVPACHECNRKKRARPYLDFLFDPDRETDPTKAQNPWYADPYVGFKFVDRIANRRFRERCLEHARGY